MISRRKIVKTLGMSIGASLVPGSLWAQQQRDNHLYLANQIRKKFSGKELTILHPKGCVANLQAVVKSFFELTNVKVHLKEGSLNSISSEIILNSQLAGKGSYIDIGIPATFAMPDIVESGFIVDLTSLAAAYEPPELRKNFLYNMGDFYKGRLYGYQTDGDCYLMFYKKSWLESPKMKDLYQKRFQTELKIPTTWQELDRQIAFFHDPSQNRFGGNLYRNSNYTLWEFWMRLHAKGSFPVNDSFQPLLTEKPSLEALKELIAVSKWLAPEVKKDGLFENFQSFSKGNSYCNLGWGGTQKFLHGPQSKIKNDLVFAMPPGNTRNGVRFSTPYFNWGWNYVVSKKSREPELSYLFCLFASTGKISSLSVEAQEGYFDPFRVEHYGDPMIQKTYGSQFLKVHEKALAQSIPDFYVKGQGQYFAALKEGLRASLTGQLSPEATLASISDKWSGITKSIGQAHQAEQWKFLKKSYPEKILKALK